MARETMIAEMRFSDPYETALQLLKNNLRIAEPGEFTRRALENDKLDLTKVEALADLINANTEKQRELAFKGLEGNLSDYTTNILIKLKKILANVEAIIDFVDEDLPTNIRKNM